MSWPPDSLIQTELDQGTDKPNLARTQINALATMLKTILAEAPVGSSLLTSDDEGSGNGIDADLLDGLHAAAFALLAHNHSAANITSGILAIARGGTGKGSYVNAWGPLHYNDTLGEFGAAEVGSVGQVLTSNGAGSAGTFQSLPAGALAADFWDGEINALSTSGSFDQTIATGLGADISWGITGIRRTDGNASADILSGGAIDNAGFTYQLGAGDAVINVAAAPAAGSIRVIFSHSDGQNVGWRVRLWARKNI